MTTIKDWLNNATKKLLSVGIESARLDSLILLVFVLNKDKAWVLANQDYSLENHLEEKIQRCLVQRLRRVPIAYITGIVEFYGLELKIDKRVLIPRPETEQLVSLVKGLAKNKAKVLEIGTGSGAIAIALRSIRNDLQITASDLDEDALQLAQENASKYSFHDINFLKSDLTSDINGTFDLIVANLPYLAKNDQVSPETRFEPKTALYSQDSGFWHYKRLIKQIHATNILNSRGRLVLELNPWQKQQLATFASEFNLSISNNDQISKFCLVLEI